MKITVVIPTIGRIHELINTLKDLGKQKLEKDRWECIIITQSDLEILEIVKIVNECNIKLRIFYLQIPNQNLAMNIALKEAKGDILLTLDDDIKITSSDFLESHLKNFKDKNLPGVAGLITGPDGKMRDEKHTWSNKKRVGWLYFPSNYTKPAYVLTGGGGNTSVRIKFALSIDGYDANFIRGAHRGETDFCLRLTKKYGPMYYNPDAKIIHLKVNTGGNRNWGAANWTTPLHHINGEWYFILNGLKQRTIYFSDLHHHLAALFFRQIFNERNRKNPIALVLSMFKSFYGCTLSLIKVFKKPKTLKYFNNFDYKLIYSNDIK